MRLIPALLAAALALHGCDQITSETPAEVFTFKYAHAVPTEAGTPFYYRFTRPDGTPCEATPDSVRLQVFVGEVQRKTGLYADLRACSEVFLVGLNEVQDVRDASEPFRYRIVGSNNDAQIMVSRLQLPTSRRVDPAEAFIETAGGLVVDQPTTRGAATLFYRDNDDFTCQGGGPVWELNTDRQRPTFFEMTLTDLTADEAAGEFQCIAHNSSDDQDPLFLIVLDGSFRMAIQ